MDFVQMRDWLEKKVLIGEELDFTNGLAVGRDSTGQLVVYDEEKIYSFVMMPGKVFDKLSSSITAGIRLYSDFNNEVKHGL